MVRFANSGTIADDPTQFAPLDGEFSVHQSEISGQTAGEAISGSDKLPLAAFEKGQKLFKVVRVR